MGCVISSLMVDNFVGLYPAMTVSTLEFVKAFLSWVGILSVPKVLRSDVGSQFSDMAERLKILLKYQHIIVVSYHPQANWMAEHRIKEVGVHLRALVYEYLIKSEWSDYLPLVQRIINYTVDGPIGTQPGRVIFRDMVDSDLAMDLSEGQIERNPEDY